MRNTLLNNTPLNRLIAVTLPRGLPLVAHRLILSLWNRAFLEERPSISLSFFRLAVAFTVGAHIIPTLIRLEDNYLSWAFKEKNFSFFTIPILEIVAKSPDWLVWLMTAWFLVFWFFFLIGLWSRVSCVLMGVGCYYFYALNSTHIGTLSYDILLVTLFLMYLTPYHGDYFSIDSIIHGNPEAYKQKRPFFLQRLLQLQIACNYFYTALYKVTAEGNWVTDNPYYYLMASGPESVIKHFPGRTFLTAHPDLCYAIGVGVFCWEFSMPLLLFIPRLRWIGIGTGFFFHFLLVTTMHVPTIFLFLFPAQLLLFINPEKIVAWIDKRRERNQQNPMGLLLYDGQCGFCQGSMRRVQILDLFGKFKAQDLHAIDNLETLNPALNKSACLTRMHYVESGRVYAGFYAFKRIAAKLPLLFPLLPLLYIPGIAYPGQAVYDWIAKNRHRLKRGFFVV